TEVSTTTTSTLPECQNDEDCNPDSPGGAFVCLDGHCVLPSTTTTTTSTTTSTAAPTTTTIESVTTTTVSPTTTTTLPACLTTAACPTGVCVNGTCQPQCTVDSDCPSSPTGSFVCTNNRCESGGEICGDCIDNDGDGLTDFEDPDCCGNVQTFPM